MISHKSKEKAKKYKKKYFFYQTRFNDEMYANDEKKIFENLGCEGMLLSICFIFHIVPTDE